MTFSVIPFGLPSRTIFRRGDFNRFSSLYTEMMTHGIVRDCVPVVDKNYLCFQMFKSASDQIPLYELSITRDNRHDRFIYEAKTSDGVQISQGTDLETIIKKFKWFMAKKHHIQAWRQPKRRTD